MSTDFRSTMIRSIQEQMPKEMLGARDMNTLRGTLLSALVMARGMGFTKDEVIGTTKEEWLHLVELDNRTVKGAK